MIEEKFTRVSLNKELTANADGMPTIRECLDTELLMSFLDDEGAEHFDIWWHQKGSKSFQDFVNEKTGMKKPGKFRNVEFPRELTLLTEGKPAFRNCFDHEIMLVFKEGSERTMFEEWWEEEASISLALWID